MLIDILGELLELFVKLFWTLCKILKGDPALMLSTPDMPGRNLSLVEFKSVDAILFVLFCTVMSSIANIQKLQTWHTDRYPLDTFYIHYSRKHAVFQMFSRNLSQAYNIFLCIQNIGWSRISVRTIVSLFEHEWYQHEELRAAANLLNCI